MSEVHLFGLCCTDRQGHLSMATTGAAKISSFKRDGNGLTMREGRAFREWLGQPRVKSKKKS